MITLIPEAQAALRFETYPNQPAIDGVWLQALHKHRGENGWFMEYARVTTGSVQNLPVDFDLRQVSISHAAPHRINAFHIHTKLPQNELWTVVHGQLTVWLIDLRATSSSARARRRVTLTGEQPAQLFIPAGVAHGYQAGAGGATLIYAMDQQFDLQDPNEGRLPWDFFGADLWAEDRG